MNPKWIILVVSIWIVLGLIGGIMEGAYMGSGEESTLNSLMTSQVMTSTTLWGRISGVFTDGQAWGALVKLVTFDLAMFEGGWAIFQWIFFFPMAIALVLTIALAIIGAIR